MHVSWLLLSWEQTLDSDWGNGLILCIYNATCIRTCLYHGYCLQALLRRSIGEKKGFWLRFKPCLTLVAVGNMRGFEPLTLHEVAPSRKAGVFPYTVCVVWNSLAPKLYVHVHVYAGLHFGVLFYGKGYVTNNCLINHLKCLDVITIQRSPISWHCLVVEEYHIQHSQWYYTLLPHFGKFLESIQALNVTILGYLHVYYHKINKTSIIAISVVNLKWEGAL